MKRIGALMLSCPTLPMGMSRKEKLQTTFRMILEELGYDELRDIIEQHRPKLRESARKREVRDERGPRKTSSASRA